MHDDATTRTAARGGDALDLAIERAASSLKTRQLPSGAWLAMEDYEPRTSAMHLITLAFVDRLNLVEARGFARFLATEQRPDGGFPAYPFAPGSDLSATALVYGALHAADAHAGLDEQGAVRARALDFIHKSGGFEAVLRRLPERGDLTPVFLAMVGLVDPFELPDPSLAFMLAPPVVDAMLKKINAGVLSTVIFLAAVTRYLRERVEPSSLPARLVHEQEARVSIDFIEGWLNPNGNNNGTTVQTDQAIATLFALGRSPESPRVGSALSWFDKLKIADERGLRLRAFTNENWMTAFALRALLRAGISRDDPAVEDGLDYLCFSQSKLPMPEVNLRRENAHRTGGWGFEVDNLILPDTDDTGIVLSAMGLALDRGEGIAPLSQARASRVRDAVTLALANCLDMQSPDGGWAGFVWNLGSKGKGPIFNKPIPVPSSLVDAVRFFADPPVELGNPPVEGLTGRVLQGLGANGFSRTSPEVIAAAEFLKARQCDDGSFWARWLVGYVAATASVVSGLADCRWDMGEPWVRRAVDWLIAKQNDDGGWGETPAAYEEPEAGHFSPSMPPLTGIVLIALLDAGLGDHDAVRRGVDYLLATQDDEGTWPSNEWMQIYEPYSTYYFFEGDAWTRTLEALAKARDAWRRPHDDEADARLAQLFAPAPRYGDGRPREREVWSGDALRRMRGAADGPADEVIREVFARDQVAALRRTMGALVTTDEPVPAGLPAPARRYFADTEALPAWADPALVSRGQRLFTEHGWLMASALFCSSLPQAYCAARGAAVLTETQGMTRHVYRRILETAQFVFDICVEGNLAPGGRGIRAAQKVRLMHATIRHLVLLKGEWDTDALGLPINQEDMAGTLMTFSVVLLDGLERAGVEVEPEEAEAFLHLWKVTGHFLGVDPDLMPVDVADGRALMQAIRDDQWQQSAQGRLLARDLIASMERFLPGRILDNLPEALIRFYAPDPAPAILGIEGGALIEGVLEAGARLDEILDVVGLGLGPEDRLMRVVHLAARELMVGMIAAQRQGKQARFRIPNGLVRDWRLSD